MPLPRFRLAALITFSLMAYPFAATAIDGEDDFAAEAEADVPTYEIIYKQSEFSPFELKVPADKNIKIVVKNEGRTPIEFESRQLNREKIVQPGHEVVFTFAPLKAGTYKYINEFNAAQKGFITVK